MYISNVPWHLKIKQGRPKNPITNIFKKFTKKEIRTFGNCNFGDKSWASSHDMNNNFQGSQNTPKTYKSTKVADHKSPKNGSIRSRKRGKQRRKQDELENFRNYSTNQPSHQHKLGQPPPFIKRRSNLSTLASPNLKHLVNLEQIRLGFQILPLTLATYSIYKSKTDY